MRSHFSAQTLAEIFRDLYMAERSGVLVLNRDEMEKRVHFDRGMILYADSSLEEEQLGYHLVQEGRLSTGALTEARESVEGEPSVPDLGRVLVNRELIGRATLHQAVRSILDTVVESVFGWEGGRARFVEGDPYDTVFETDILSTIEVILLGVSHMAGFEPIYEAMQGLDNRLRIRRPTPIPFERLALSPAHGFILSRVDGNTNLNEVISILPPGEEEVAVRFLFGLFVMGVLEYEPPLAGGTFKVADLLRDHADRQALERSQEQMIRHAYAQIRKPNPFEILGLANDATLPETEAAYSRLKNELSRERILPKVREKFRSEMTLIESRLLEAFLTITQPGRGSDRPLHGDGPVTQAGSEVAVQDLNVRVEMDRAKSKVAIDKANRVADAYYAKGRRAMLEGDFHNAIQYGKLAVSYNPSDARYYFLLADCQSRNPEARWQRMAEENFTKATELDPWNPEYWISLGRLYKQRGLKLRARRQFEEALKLAPNNSELLSELDSLR